MRRNPSLPRWRSNTQFDRQKPVALPYRSGSPANVGGSSEQEMRRPEAPSKCQKSDPVRFGRKCRTTASQQSRLRSRRWLRSAMPGLRGRRAYQPDRPRTKRRASRLQVQQRVPLPGRQATPSVQIEDSACESWPRPSQTVAQHGPPYPSACRVVFHGSHIVMKTDILRCMPLINPVITFSAASSAANSR